MNEIKPRTMEENFTDSVNMVEYEHYLTLPPEERPERFNILKERLNSLFSRCNEL